MTNAATMAVSYLGYDEANLEEEIGQRLSVAALEPEAGIVPPGRFSSNVRDLAMGAEARALGLRLFKRMSKELHKVFCGDDPDDAADRAMLREALKIGDKALVAAIAAFLAGPLGIGAAVAAAVAALVLKRIFKPAGQEICSFWEEKLASG